MVGNCSGYPTCVLQPGAFQAGAFLFSTKHLKSLNDIFVYVSEALQNQFWTEIGYIDADSKVSMTQIGLFVFYEPKFKNMQKMTKT